MLQHTSSEVTVTMLKHTKRQVRYIKVSYAMRLLFLMFVTAVCMCAIPFKTYLFIRLS